MNVASLRCLASVAALMCLSSCVPNLPARLPVGIEVELYFIRDHSAITGSWSASLTQTRYETANFPNAQRTAGGQIQAPVDVIAPQLVEFPPVMNLFPGIWRVEIEVRDSGNVLRTIECRNLDIGQDQRLAQGDIYVVRWVEGVSDCNEAELDPDPPTPVERDVQLVSIGAPATGSLGQIVNVTADVVNNGSEPENVLVELAMRLPSGGAPNPIAQRIALVNPNASAQVAFAWDTGCVGPVGDYLLTAAASVPNDTTANNEQSQTIALAADRELRITNFTGPATVRRGQPGGALFRANLVNGESSGESGVSVSFADSSSEPAGTVQWLNPPPGGSVDLVCGGTEQLFLSYFPSTLGSGTVIHQLQLTISTAIPGDDPTDNAVSLSISVTP